MKYVAIYLPAGEREDRIHEFRSKWQAEKFVLSQVCDLCKKDEDYMFFPTPCEFEWIVMQKRKLKIGMKFADMMEAAGFKRVDKEFPSV